MQLVNQNVNLGLLRDEDARGFKHLESHLNKKICNWLRKMDWYVLERTHKNKAKLYEYCKDIFASSFYFGMIGAKGEGHLHKTWNSKVYELKEWTESQSVEEREKQSKKDKKNKKNKKNEKDKDIKKCSFIAAPRPHHLQIIEKNKKVKMVGFHDDIFWGDFSLFFGNSFQCTGDHWEEIIFENFNGKWLITSYNETVYDYY